MTERVKFLVVSFINTKKKPTCMDEYDFERFRKQSRDDLTLTRQSMTLSTIVLGAGMVFLGADALTTPVYEFGESMNPLAQVGFGVMGVGCAKLFLDACYIMARDIYRESRGFVEACEERSISPYGG